MFTQSELAFDSLELNLDLKIQFPLDVIKGEFSRHFGPTFGCMGVQQYTLNHPTRQYLPPKQLVNNPDTVVMSIMQIIRSISLPEWAHKLKT